MKLYDGGIVFFIVASLFVYGWSALDRATNGAQEVATKEKVVAVVKSDAKKVEGVAKKAAVKVKEELAKVKPDNTVYINE